MSNRGFAVLGFRLTGIYVFVQAILLLRETLLHSASFIGGLIGPPYGRDYLWMGWAAFADIVTILSLSALACFLISRGHVMATRLFPTEESETNVQPPLAIQAFAYSVIGVFLFAMGLADLGAQIARLVMSGYVRWYGVIGMLVGPMLQLLSGIVLFFGSHGLVRLWSRLRYSGLRRQMGLCMHCGYDLTGNTSGKCPECGTPLEHPAPPVPPEPKVILTEKQMSDAGSPGGIEENSS